MKNFAKLLILGAIAFAILLVATAPATLFVRFLGSESQLRFEGVSGSLWRGAANRVHSGYFSLGPLQWQIHPLQLLIGRLSADINIEPGEDPLYGSIRLYITPNKTLVVRQAVLYSDTDWVLTQAALPIAASGELVLNIERLIAPWQQFPIVDAQLQWRDASITYPQVYTMGAYTATLRHYPAEPNNNQPQYLLGELNDIDSVIHANGRIKITPDKQYQAQIRILARDHAHDDLKRALPLLGETDEDGAITINHQGHSDLFWWTDET